MSLRRAVVVGATGGIGRAIVARLVAADFEVHACARSSERLDALAAEYGCSVHVLDVLDGERVARELTSIDNVALFVFAAGVGGTMVPFERADRSHIDSIIGPNVVGLLNCVHAVAPGMVERASGHIVLIGSIAGLHPVSSPTYAASKGATHSFARSLSLALAGTKVRVTEVCPGRVNTDCVPAANPDIDVRALEPDADTLLQPNDIADAVMWAVGQPERVKVELIELLPATQVVGGSAFVPFDPVGS